MSVSERRLPAAYEPLLHIPAAGLAWEYLRRNRDYRKDYRRQRSVRFAAANREVFSRRWGLFPAR